MSQRWTDSFKGSVLTCVNAGLCHVRGMRAFGLLLALSISVMCQVACSSAITTDDDRCVPHTYHACFCNDGRDGIRLCSVAGVGTGSCDCDSDAAKELTTMVATGKPGQSSGTNNPGKTSSGNTSDKPSSSAAGRGAPANMPENTTAGSGAVMGGQSAPASTGPVSVIEEPADEAAYIFDQRELRTYNIIIADADLARIDAAPAAEQLVPAMLEFDGQSYGPYSVRYKGGQGSFMYPCTMSNAGSPKIGKCSMKLDFNDTDPDARFFGLKKLNFHSMNADGSMLRDRLGYQLYREMGIAAPRAVHARVLINGQLEGLFIAVEQIDSRFSRAHFSDGGEGNVYKEVWPMHDTLAPYMEALETNKDDMPSVQGLLDFKLASDESAAAAQSYFDRDYMMRYLAVDRVIINDDGVLHFWCNEITGQGNNPGEFGNHNYYWYEETSAPRFWLIPWDLDHSFDNYPAVHLDLEWTQAAACACRTHSVAGSDRAASCDPLVSHFISWLPDYDAAVDEFIAGPMSKQHVDTLVQTWSDQIRSAVTEAGGVNLAPDEAAWSSAVEALITKVDAARTNRGFAY
jgi:spore coat protein H